jgi:hypothetical protein
MRIGEEVFIILDDSEDKTPYFTDDADKNYLLDKWIIRCDNQ